MLPSNISSCLFETYKGRESGSFEGMMSLSAEQNIGSGSFKAEEAPGFYPWD